MSKSLPESMDTMSDFILLHVYRVYMCLSFVYVIINQLQILFFTKRFQYFINMACTRFIHVLNTK